MKARDNQIDVLKGIGMLCVIIGHLTTIGVLRNFIYTFHMPLFFMLSGYFYKQQSFSKLFSKMGKSIIMPYSIFALFIALYKYSGGVEWIWAYLFADGYKSTAYIGGSQLYIGAMWFLPALFWCRVVYNIMGKNSEKITYSLAILLSAVSYILGKYIINIPLGFLEGTQALVFYAAGILWHKHKKALHLKALIILAIVWMSSIFVGFISMADFYYSCHPINIAVAISACLIIASCVNALNRYKSKIVRTFLGAISWIGRNSLCFLCFHAVLLSLHIQIYWGIAVFVHIAICVFLINIFHKLQRLYYAKG